MSLYQHFFFAINLFLLWWWGWLPCTVRNGTLYFNIFIIYIYMLWYPDYSSFPSLLLYIYIYICVYTHAEARKSNNNNNKICSVCVCGVSVTERELPIPPVGSIIQLVSASSEKGVFPANHFWQTACGWKRPLVVRSGTLSSLLLFSSFFEKEKNVVFPSISSPKKEKWIKKAKNF